MKKKNNKNENNNIKHNKEIIDLTAFITPDDVMADTNGSYTGTTAKTYYSGKPEQPVQDADDL